MTQSIANVSVLVDDYDRAIGYYRDILGFELVEDTLIGPGKRWVLVAPPEGRGARLLLAQATTANQEAAVGNQCGGRVFLFLHTDNFWRDYEIYSKRNVRFLEKPREEVYGTVVVFEDLFGNKWDLLHLKKG